MKKCRRCSKPASLHITEMRDEEVHELHLCESCYNQYIEYSEATETETETEDESQELTIKLSSEQDLEEIDQLLCPNCGITFREFRSQGRLGCPHDYVEFQAELLPLLENIHGETQHCGKLPAQAPNSSQQQSRLIRLRKELRTAIDGEEYENAARLRDDIQNLETDLGLDDTDSDEIV